MRRNLKAALTAMLPLVPENQRLLRQGLQDIIYQLPPAQYEDPGAWANVAAWLNKLVPKQLGDDNWQSKLWERFTNDPEEPGIEATPEAITLKLYDLRLPLARSAKQQGTSLGKEIRRLLALALEAERHAT